MREVLVGAAVDRLGLRHEHDGSAEDVAVLGEHEMIEIGERDDQPHLVEIDEVAERSDVAGVVDTGHDRSTIRVIERGRERIDVRGDRRRADGAKGGDDVDTLPGAREQNRGHERAA